MRRYPTGGPIESQTQIGSSAYYISANQKVTVSPEKCSKKTWGQRLKISKNNEKLSNDTKEVEYNLNNNHNKNSISNQSALSKSMKYAEPWLYGTVRGIPAPSVHNGHGIFGRFPHEMAVVVCSCPEYLNGTKREVKKASICKKCKGSRLPLAPMGGTVRIRPSPGMIPQSVRTSGGTMRLPPASVMIKQRARPSILDSQNDPYDLMRRSRLVSPELKPVLNNKKSRAKSISPSRSRSRTRKRSPSPNENSINIGNRSRSASRLNKIKSPECWIDKLDPDPGGRRSILTYDINPYDLLAKTNSSSEFSPINDDNFEYDLLALHSKKYETILNPSHNGNMNSINNNTNSKKRGSISSGSSIITGTTTSISGQRIRISSTPRQLSSSSTSSNYEDANDFFYEQIQIRNSTPIDSSQINIYSNLTLNDSTSSSASNKDVLRPASQNSTPTSTSANNSIKSILKRSSYHEAADDNSSDNFKSNLNNSKLNDKNCLNQISNNNNSSNNSSSNQSNISNNSNSKKINRDRDKNNRNNSISNNNQSNYSNQPNCNTVSGSHFYLPLPTTRKKVQFLVDNDEVIQISSSPPRIIESHAEVQTQCELVENDDDDEYHNLNNIIESNVDDDEDDEVFVSENSNSSTTCATITTDNNIKLEINENINENEITDAINNEDVVDEYFNNGYGNNGQEIVETSDDGDYESSGTSTQIFPRRSLLRRSFSERRNSNNSDITKNDIVFLDTMALRMKATRKDSRTLFERQHDEKSKSADKIPNHQPESEPSPDYSENEKSSSDSSYSGYDDDNIYEDYSPTINVIVNNLKEPQSKSKNINKTVVTVSQESQPTPQIIFNKESPAIHRLEIKHDEGIGESESSKTTSIMINGDDCYSTVNVNNNTPIYQSSVVVNDENVSEETSGILKSSSNTITISVGAKRAPDEEMIYQNNKMNTLLSGNGSTSVVPIVNNRGGSTLIKLDYNDSSSYETSDNEIAKLLRNPVEAVRLNLIPHVCGKTEESNESKTNDDETDESTNLTDNDEKRLIDRNSFISKLLEDSTLASLADGLDNELIAKLIENSLIRLKENRHTIDLNGTKDEESMTKLIDISLEKIKEERQKIVDETKVADPVVDDNKDAQSNRDSVSSGNSYLSANYELFEFDKNGSHANNNNTTDDMSDCYQSCSSELTADEDGNMTRSKFYQMLVDATLSEIEISTNIDDDHHYESIRLNGGDPIYEEITDVPPPLPLSAPPDIETEKKNSRSIFEGASKYDILSYLVDAKERGIVPEESYAFNFSTANEIILEENTTDMESMKNCKNTKNDSHTRQNSGVSGRISHISSISEASMDENGMLLNDKINIHRKSSAEIERNDSGVGSETSKSCRSRYQISPNMLNEKNCPIHLCEDCDGTVETQITDSGVLFAPLVCRKCAKKRAERKEIITEIVETEEKYGRDLQIILEEFYQPMLVAGLLTQEQLSAIFLNTEELLENNQALSERMRDALDIANEQGDDDLLTVNIGRLVLDAAPMLHAFESYCVRQASSSLLLANLEKEKELLRIFLRVSQMENTVLRRMNLNSFLMVPVQRVTKYPLLLARLYKVTPPHLDGREALKQAQEKIELHLNHMNREAKDVPTKLWRRISSSSPNRRSTCEIDMINIKLRKMAVDILEWNHDEVRFAVEGRLLFTQPTDNNWRKGRTIKLTHVHALLVTNGKPSTNYKADRAMSEPLNFPRHTGIRESSLLLVREKGGRYTLLREPLFLDRCIVCSEADWDDYFEVQEISSKDTFIFKAEDSTRTKHWYTQLQYHAQGMGAWRKRRNALANIMINGMMTRT